MPLSTAGFHLFFHVIKTGSETVISSVQSYLRLNTVMTRIIYHSKQHIAKLTLGSSLVACLQSILQLAKLLLYLSPYRFAVLPVKAYLGSLALQLIGTQQRRQSLGYAV